MKDAWDGRAVVFALTSAALFLAGCGESHGPGDGGGDVIGLPSDASADVVGSPSDAMADVKPGGDAGLGCDGGLLSVTPTAFDFGRMPTGRTSAPHRFIVRNCADRPSGRLGLSLGGTGSTQFSFTTDECSGRTLDSGASCGVDVIYAPTASGAHSAQLHASASPGRTVTAALSGTAERAFIQLVPGTQNFGSVGVGSSSATVDFTVTNVGGLETGVLDHDFGGADATEFTAVSSTCRASRLPGGASCTITVRFDAGFAGAKSATLDVTDGFLSASSSLSATSLNTDAFPVITPSTHDFGGASISTVTSSTIFTVYNPGGSALGPLTVMLAGANPADFMLGAGTCAGGSIPAGGSCTVAIQFAPTALGARSATLRVAAPSGPATAALSGIGTAHGGWSLTPTAVAFGTVPVGMASTPVVFTAENTGSLPSGPPTVSLLGPGAASWQILTHTCTGSVLGGGTCTITVRFAPSSAVPMTAQLEITSTPGGTDVSDLMGTGT